MDSIAILNRPVLLLLFGAALLLYMLGKLRRTGRGRLTLASAFLSVAASAYALILGVGIGEVMTVLMLFLCLNLEGWK